MDKEKAVSYIESSFLSALLQDENITDISYNGGFIYYLDNILGRRKSNIVIDFDTAKDFIRQIANVCEKQFSFQNPLLDVSVGKYRINAVHQSIAKKNNNDVLTFSIRIASVTPRIKYGSDYFPLYVDELLKTIILSHQSIVIGGITGSGKTELQKFLIREMEENARLVVIDNIMELDLMSLDKNLDINFWQADSNHQNGSIQDLVRNALRSNPDWLIVAESRGKEMLEVLNSALTGHPIITTIHALNAESMPSRMARMIMMNEQKMNYDDVMEDIRYHLRFYVYLSRLILPDGHVKRFISKMGYLNDTGFEIIFSSDGNDNQYYQLSNSIKSILNLRNVSSGFINTFCGGEKQ